MTQENKKQQIETVLSLLAVYRGRELADNAATRSLSFRDIGLSSLTLASAMVELEERLDRPLDFRAFAGVETVGDLLRAVGLD